MSNKQNGSVIIIDSSMPRLFRRMAEILEEGRIEASDILEVRIMTPNQETERRMLEVILNNDHDPNNCLVCITQKEAENEVKPVRHSER